MCYVTYLSTTSDSNLKNNNSKLINFEKIADLNADPVITLLGFPNKWFAGSNLTCSCEFRHLMSDDLGFGEPVDWYKEEPEEIAATKELYVVINSLISAGYEVDCVDRWEGAAPEDIKVLEVYLDEVSLAEFRLFENYKFIIKKSKIRIK